MAASDTSCAVCKLGFALISQGDKNSCIVANIENCDTYYISEV